TCRLRPDLPIVAPVVGYQQTRTQQRLREASLRSVLAKESRAADRFDDVFEQEVDIGALPGTPPQLYAEIHIVLLELYVPYRIDEQHREIRILLVEVLEWRNEPFRREGRVSLYADFLIGAALHNVRGGVGHQMEGRYDA